MPWKNGCSPYVRLYFISRVCFSNTLCFSLAFDSQSKSDRTKVVEKLDELLEYMNACRERADELIGYQKEFRIDLTMYDEMATGFYDIRMRQNLYRTLIDWEEALAGWLSGDFNNLNVADITELNSKTIKNCLQFNKYLPENDIVPVLQRSAELFKEKLPVIGYLRNPNLRGVSYANNFRRPKNF